MVTGIDVDKLSKEFGIDKRDLESLEGDESIDNSKDVIDDMDISDDASIENPDKILESNINKANTVLDKVISEMKRGNFSARMAEVAGQLVNAVTNAVDKVYLKNVGIDNLLIKDKMLNLKEKEASLREKLVDARGKIPREKLIVTDRETILGMLKEENKKPLKVKTLKILKTKKLLPEKEGNR